VDYCEEAIAGGGKEARLSTDDGFVDGIAIATTDNGKVGVFARIKQAANMVRIVKKNVEG